MSRNHLYQLRITPIRDAAWRRDQWSQCNALKQRLAALVAIYMPTVGPRLPQLLRSHLDGYYARLDGPYAPQIHDLRRQLRTARRALRTAMWRLEIARPNSGMSPQTYLPVYECDFHTYLIHGVRDFRARLKRIRAQRRYIIADPPRHNQHWDLFGGVHPTPGEIFREVKGIKKRRVKRSKAPKTLARHVGIEIEFCAPANEDRVSDALIEAGLEAHVQLKADGSVVPNSNQGCTGECRYGESCECCSCATEAERDDCQCDCECECRCVAVEYGHELAILCLESEYKSVVKRTCRVLRGLNAYVNKTCGLHVHIDQRGRVAARSYKNLFNAQALLFELVPVSRRNNSYCYPIPHGDILRAPSSRYLAINAAALSEHNTIEVRLHSGTVRASKINHWISLLIKICNSRRIPRPIDTIDALASYVRLGARLKRYLQTRISELNPELQTPARTTRTSRAQRSA